MSHPTVVVTVVILVSMQRLAELWISKRNIQRQLERGAAEYGANHYWMLLFLHSTWLFGILLEGLLRPAPSGWIILLALPVTAAAQLLRYWAIVTLGDNWNTRIVVVPGMVRVEEGPYKFLRHPNYVAVAIELISIALLANAWITAIVATAVNAIVLLGVRIPAEERALEDAENVYEEHSK
jgi:methyltransferase